MENVVIVVIGILVVYIMLGFKFGSIQIAIFFLFEIMLNLFNLYGSLEKTEVDNINHYYSYVVYFTLFVGFCWRVYMFLKYYANRD